MSKLWEVFVRTNFTKLFAPSKGGSDRLICVGPAGVHTAIVLYFARGELPRTTKSFQFELRQLIGLINSMHNIISLKFVVLPIFN